MYARNLGRLSLLRVDFLHSLEPSLQGYAAFIGISPDQS
jgi:hypothetical protein